MIQSAQREHFNSPRVFNSIFETGVRAVFILVSAYPDALDLEDLVALDHLVVHSKDVGGPNSLHPATATHATEMLVRRELVYNGLLLMQTRSLVNRIADAGGMSYRAGEEAHNFIGYLSSQYFQELHQAASFLASLRKSLGKPDFDQLIGHQLERWAIQFQSVEVPGVEG